MMPGAVAVDFDGVIHCYRRGWDDGSIYDPPVPGAFDALRILMQSYAVFIHTSRDPKPVAEWITEQSSIPTTVDDVGLTFWAGRGLLLVTSRKLPAVAYIDDRGIRFETWDQTLAALAALEPAR